MQTLNMLDNIDKIVEKELTKLVVSLNSRVANTLTEVDTDISMDLKASERSSITPIKRVKVLCDSIINELN